MCLNFVHILQDRNSFATFSGIKCSRIGRSWLINRRQSLERPTLARVIVRFYSAIFLQIVQSFRLLFITRERFGLAA